MKILFWLLTLGGIFCRAWNTLNSHDDKGLKEASTKIGPQHTSLDESEVTWNSHFKKRDSAPHIHTRLSGNGSMFSIPTSGSGQKVLIMILAFDLNHFKALKMVIHEYKMLCENGWNINIVIDTAVHWNNHVRKTLLQHAYCKRIQNSFGIELYQWSKRMNIKLAEKHRVLLKQNIDNYDVFVYQEDDIILSHFSFEYYLMQSKKLFNIVETYEDYAIGFIRYRTDNLYNHTSAQILPQNIDMVNSFMEELPTVQAICLKDKYGTAHKYIRFNGNIHQALWVLTKEQVIAMEKRCSFSSLRMWNTGRQYSREYMSTFSLYATNLDGYRAKSTPSCRVTKLFPTPFGESVTMLAVMHYYKQRHITLTNLQEFVGKEMDKGRQNINC
jgi:hypothetical protein